MRFYWLKDQQKQGQFDICWEPGKTNLADYTNKHHPSSHHKRVRPIYLYMRDESPRTLQGCIEILSLNETQELQTKSCGSQIANIAYIANIANIVTTATTIIPKITFTSFTCPFKPNKPLHLYLM
jgi:hypothetical protein